jgi:hypothetical protein
MKKTINTVLLFCMAYFVSCDKENDDYVDPLSDSDFPQVLLLSDEGDGDLEDEDKFSFKITLADRSDVHEPGGKVIPLDEDVTVQFAITGIEGFDKLTDYIKGAEAFYEVDDCTTSLDQGIDLNLQFNPATGIGSVRFPKGVEEIEIEFETDGSLFDDDDFNTDERSITIQLTGGNGKAAVNKTAEFTYTIQDDEGIYGEWELDIHDAAAFSKFRQLFGPINEDIKDLDVDDVEEITISFEFEEVKATVVLKETETIDDCGSPSEENKIIEIEAEIEDIDDDLKDGDVEFGETLELDNGSFKEFTYKGSFIITGGQLQLSLEGEFDDETTDEITLILDK